MSRIAQQRATTRPEVERSLGRLRKAHHLAEPFVKVRIHTEDGTPFARPTSAPDHPARADYVRQAAFDDTPQEQRVLHYLQKHEQITRKDAAHLCRLSLDQASRLLRRLVNQGKLRARGSGDQRTTRGREHAKDVRTIRKHEHAATVRRPTAQHPISLEQLPGLVSTLSTRSDPPRIVIPGEVAPSGDAVRKKGAYQASPAGLGRLRCLGAAHLPGHWVATGTGLSPASQSWLIWSHFPIHLPRPPLAPPAHDETLQ